MENLDSSEKILIEKRKRHQTYKALEYLLSMSSYFDFFSADAFELSKTSKTLAYLCKKPVTTDLFFLSYFYNDSQICKMLEKFEFVKTLNENIYTYFPKLLLIEKATKKNVFKSFISFIFRFSKKTEKEIYWSNELCQIFEKAVENALIRFKTPIITSEILFITLMEQKTNRISKIIRNCFQTEIEWYLFRYELIKIIHEQESTIRSEVSKNQQYFAYLLKSQLPDLSFKQLIEMEKLPEGVSSFRNHLISEVLKVNIFEKLLLDTRTSIKLNKKRRYST